MLRRKLLSWIFCASNVLMYCCCEASPSPSNVHNNLAINKFQSALQQQNTLTILSSIEERLRNLDNVYAIQLSQSLDGKLDQYSRKLENLDSKIMRLEALMMLNLGKISENISTKNFKDDIGETNIFRKLDSIYESVIHRLSYMERKYEANFGKMQEKADITMKRLEKIEENQVKRNSDFQAELSDTIFAIDDLKTTYTSMEEKLLNITEAALNVSKDNYILLSKTGVETRKSMNKLHDNLIGNLQYIDNKTSHHIKISDDSNTLLKKMKVELKEDFNNYANKVADMNSDIWKNSDTAEDDLKSIAIIVNKTKDEVQNGVRSLMLQIGKLANKENEIPLGTNNHYEELEKKLNDNFDRILTNQNVFLESCHRLQMDESQIESEISVMLNKLIDMLEKKLTSEAKDIKNFEKALKNHDNRMHRNLYQANQNIISLFEKSTMSTQIVTNEIKKVNSDLNALFSFVQSTLTEESPSTSMINRKIILDKLSQIENFTRNLSIVIQTTSIHPTLDENITRNDIHKEIQKLYKSLSSIVGKINNNTRVTCLQRDDIDKAFEAISKKYLERKTDNPGQISKEKLTEAKRDETLREAIIKVFGPGPADKAKSPSIVKKRKCKKRLEELIDVRADGEGRCDDETPNKQLSNSTKKSRRKKKKFKIDIRGGFNSSEIADDVDYEDYETSTEDNGDFATYESSDATVTDTITPAISTDRNDANNNTYYSET